ncbi:hypothetical protein Hden_2196 [Hyphomicrobium denitrificans ATCC 51888]|uniref:Uncharacterized protein n=1 Tax=Hyphomicrobium denitrificans (strain ATCC 51888 / DSM 1869 / NCIMB 11706 / TK 0415) TaxID=582899 RepID=D8JR09_HYPDA|nr:hypothetical protein Hden_2196 [Hyphomicrobium denitrificans ATCC 51888]
MRGTLKRSIIARIPPHQGAICLKATEFYAARVFLEFGTTQ